MHQYNSKAETMAIVQLIVIMLQRIGCCIYLLINNLRMVVYCHTGFLKFKGNVNIYDLDGIVQRRHSPGVLRQALRPFFTRFGFIYESDGNKHLGNTLGFNC